MVFCAPLYLALLLSVVHASNWFGSLPDYAKWSESELRSWLENHYIKVPPQFDKTHLYVLVDANWANPPPPTPSHAEAGRQWTFDQYNRAQSTFANIKANTFDKWDESRLRTFLLEQGVVAPSGPREQLILLAKQKYRSYTDAAAHFSSIAPISASSAYAGATDIACSASQSVGTAAAQAAHEVARLIDDSKDYVYSTWDDNRLKSWLEEHGVVEARKAGTREELTKLASEFYCKAADPLWESWSDSYIREWLIAHNLIKSSDAVSRSSLFGEMEKYYYNASDKVWNTWSESELKGWLVEHGFLKNNAQKKRDELLKMVEDHYLSASDSVWGAWNDSDMRQWLSEHGYLDERSAGKEKRDALVELMNSKYSDASTKTAPYLVWPDARLRAYLRERGVGESALPTSRPGLLQESRIRWIQAFTRTESIFAKLKEIVNSSAGVVGEKLARALEQLCSLAPIHWARS
ncbi:hypothetical protein BS17DRAFT_426410 [Gyrodon lividus]|nr:hypothetical protein BS17DRAFT_426410 [Gyrodon lividus]